MNKESHLEEFDIDMASPENSPSHFTKEVLQGASCVTGGIFRGRAHGNTLKPADFKHFGGDVIDPPKGHVYIFFKKVSNPAEEKPDEVIKISMDETLMPPVLTQIAKKYREIK
ncbi:hypothetical protein H0H81_008613, partial [Sphagnurus paluster]